MEHLFSKVSKLASSLNIRLKHKGSGIPQKNIIIRDTLSNKESEEIYRPIDVVSRDRLFYNILGNKYDNSDGDQFTEPDSVPINMIPSLSGVTNNLVRYGSIETFVDSPIRHSSAVDDINISIPKALAGECNPDIDMVFCTEECFELYKTSDKYSAALEGEPGYGTLTPESFAKILTILKRKCNFGLDSNIIDLGCGGGRFVMHAARFAHISCGLEVEKRTFHVSFSPPF